MPTGYVRCHYISPEGFECETWFSPNTDEKFCPVHCSMVSASLAANGFNKESYIAQDKELMLNLVDATKGMDEKTAIAFYDQHYSKIQDAIEKMKHEQQISRALRQQRLEKLSDADREALRRAPVTERRAKAKSSASELGKAMKAKEAEIANIIRTRKAMGKETTREQAIMILEAD